LLFSRRKRGTSSQQPTPPRDGVAAPSTFEELDMAPLPPPEATATSAAGAPAVPVPAPASFPPLAAPDSPLTAPAPPPAAVDPDVPQVGEGHADDLDKFFAALRQVVHDAREQLPVDESQPEPVPDATQPIGTFDASSAGELVQGAPASQISSTPTFASSTELAPSTAELVASLEADRDLWRERAVVWRERAMGADTLVKALNNHMSDLQINLEDLRLAMRVLAGDGVAPPEPRAELSAGDLSWSGRPAEREVEAGPQE
jgi:hypothetical protein